MRLSGDPDGSHKLTCSSLGLIIPSNLTELIFGIEIIDGGERAVCVPPAISSLLLSQLNP